jgi:pimeloyl-ACP methyl ester carboxylesterase
LLGENRATFTPYLRHYICKFKFFSSIISLKTGVLFQNLFCIVNALPMHWAARESLKKLGCPTLIMWGRKDRWLPRRLGDDFSQIDMQS